MLLDKTKKYKGIKFLKVEQQLFQNAKKYNRKTSYNSIPINNQSSFNESNVKKTLKNSSNDIPMRYNGEKKHTPKKGKLNINKSFKKLNSCNKMDVKKFNEIIALTKIAKKKEEEKKDKDILFTRFSKANLRPLLHKKSISYKKILINKNLMTSSINPNNNNINMDNNLYNNITINMKNDTNVNKYKISFNENNEKENENNDNYCKKINLNKVSTENIVESKEKKIEKKKNWRKVFCCL